MKKMTILISLLAILAGYLWAQPLLAQAPLSRPTPDREAMDAGGPWSHRPQIGPSSYALNLPLAPASAIAAWSKIAYQEYIGNWDVFSMGGDGSNPTRLTSSGGADITPRLNRGATRLVYASIEPGNYEIYAMNVNGSGRARLTNNPANDYNPAWSPDGTKIVFNSYRDGQSEIYVMNANGSGQTRLTTNSGYDGEAVWSPDGTKIAFVSIRDTGQQIYTMKPDGSNVTRITSANAPEFPSWSPDSSQLAFSADVDGDSWLELMVINTDGSGVRALADAGANTDLWAHSWSPDGRFIANTLIGFINYQGNWYWTNAYLTGFDLTTNQLVQLGASDVAWHPDWQSTDLLPPTSSMSALPATSPSPFVVRWSGSDAGPAGILGYDVQVKDGESGTWTTWLTRSTATSGNYPGVGGNTYYFRARAWDQSGNVEAWLLSADTSTTVEALPPVSAVSPLPAYWRGDLTVSWGGSDPGGSGITTYDVQYQDGIGGAWVNWQMGTTATSATFNGTAGHTYYFRVRAIDRAQNLESWPVDPNQYSTKYSWLLSGQVTDSRDVPVFGVGASTIPSSLMTQQSRADAVYRAYGAADSLIYSVTWNSPAYSSLPTTRFLFNSLQDAQRDAVMPPADNVVNDAGFERGLFDSMGWSVTGTLTPTVVADRQYTGRYAVQLGNPPLQFSSPFTLSSQSATPAQSPQIAVDDDNRLHVVWQAGGELYYRQRDGNGSWSAAENLYSAGVPGTARILFDYTGTLHAMWSDLHGIYYQKHSMQDGWSSREIVLSTSWWDPGTPPFIVDDRGQVHAVWVCASNEICYTFRRVQGAWANPQNIIVGYYHCQWIHTPQLATDYKRQIHLVYVCADSSSGLTNIGYQRRDASGEWSRPVNISNNPYHSLSPLLAVDAQGVVHVVWQVWYGWSKWSYAQRSVGDLWTEPFDLPGSATATDTQLTVDTNGQPHVVWVDTADGDIYSTLRESNGTWVDPVNVSGTGQNGHPRLASGPNSGVHLTWATTVSPTQEVFYTHRNGMSDWLPAWNLSNSPLSSIEQALVVDGNGDPHATWVEGDNAEIVYVGPTVITVTNDSSISQIVTIPITSTSPTLSLLYHLDRTTPLTGTWLSAQIDNGATTGIVLSATTSMPPWQHHWLDVGTWAGQSITLTLTLHQTEGNFATRAYIDDVTLGSWLTPDPQAITPHQVEAAASTVITITGDNFIAPTQVRLNDTPLPDVHWVNTNTITAAVSGLPMGHYDVIVTNPGGQASGLPNALLIGHEVLLPLIRK